MNPALTIRQVVSIAEQISDKYANIRAKLCYRPDWIRSQLSQSDEAYRLEIFGMCASKQWL